MEDSRSEFDVRENLEAIRKHSDEVHKVVLYYEEKIGTLQAQIAEAESRARDADNQARAAEEKYRKAIELKDGQYENLIRDIFEIPQGKLENSIKSSSRMSYVVTAVVAVASIIIGLLTTLYTQKSGERILDSLSLSVKHSEMKVREMEGRVGELATNINGLGHKTEQLVNAGWRGVDNISVLVTTINGLRGDFGNYATKNDVALMYLHRLVGGIGNYTYREYVLAMRFAGIPQVSLPTAPVELKKWELETIGMLDRRIAELEKTPPATLVPAGRYQWASNPPPAGLVVNQMGWGYQVSAGSGATYQNLLGWHRTKRDGLLASVKFNDSAGAGQ